MNSDNRELPRRLNCLAIAAHLRDRAPKHEHQAEAKKEFVDDFCFHDFIFLSLFWPSLTSHHGETHFWPLLFPSENFGGHGKKVCGRPGTRLRRSYRVTGDADVTDSK